MGDLDEAQWRVPRLAIVNPVAWELGHVGWFAERWTLRWQGSVAPLKPAHWVNADAWFDSARVPHNARWDLPLPSRTELLDYLAWQLAATLALLRDADDLYFFRLALAHELMHGEAWAYTRQTCAYPAPVGWRRPRAAARAELHWPGGAVWLGAQRDADFVFDNEKWSHCVDLKPFSISSAVVTEGEFARFVEAGGYGERRVWSEAGWQWRCGEGAVEPFAWRRSGAGWEVREFDDWRAIDPAAALVHVNAWEAEAWCAWAGRRLPTEAEWEVAARAGLIEWGEVWEWTASDFLPYPGFAADPYREYSLPWFGSHRVVRGASVMTGHELRDPGFRNFYTPERRDVFVGFRACAA